MYDKAYNYNEMIGASKALGKVIREIKAAWLEAFGVELVVGGSSPSARFDNLLEQLRGKWSGEKNRELLIEALDIDTLGTSVSADDVIELVTNDSMVRNVDDLTANQILHPMEAVAWDSSSEEGVVEIELHVFLRAVLKRIYLDNDIRGRINVGPNRQFPRLFQWLNEYALRTEWEGGSGLKVRNLSGRGRVARYPRDPKSLKVIVDRAYL
jgi:hypothetical protein